MHIPEVAECYQVTGDYDYLLRVLNLRISKRLTSSLRIGSARFLKLGQIKSHIILSEIKHSRGLFRFFDQLVRMHVSRRFANMVHLQTWCDRGIALWAELRWYSRS